MGCLVKFRFYNECINFPTYRYHMLRWFYYKQKNIVKCCSLIGHERYENKSSPLEKTYIHKNNKPHSQYTLQI